MKTTSENRRKYNFLSDLELIADDGTVTIHTKLGPPGEVRYEIAADEDGRPVAIPNDEDMRDFFGREDLSLSREERSALAFDICQAAQCVDED